MFLIEYDVYAQSRQNLEEQRKRALAEIEETSRFLKETEQSVERSVEKLNLLDAQVVQFNRLIRGINAEIAYTDRQIAETAAKMNQMTNEIEKMKAEYARLVYQTYKNRGKYNKLIYVLSAKDFNEAYRRMKYFQQYSEFRKKQAAEITIKQEELSIVKEEMEKQKKEKEQLLAVQRQESRKLDAVKAEQNREVNNLRSQERRLRSQLLAQQQREKRLQNEIAKLIAAEAQKVGSSAANPYDRLTPDELIISTNFAGNRGRLPWPTEKGIITGYFGNKPTLFKDITLPNNGIDITTVADSDVRVVFDGEVTQVVSYPGNVLVLVRHGNYVTVYSNLASVTVKRGEKVKSRQTIGKVYTEKGAKTAVLHFEIWEIPNKPFNPEQWIAKQ